MAFCTNCGKENAQGGLFCIHCGMQLQPSDNNDVQHEAVENTNIETKTDTDNAVEELDEAVDVETTAAHDEPMSEEPTPIQRETVAPPIQPPVTPVAPPRPAVTPVAPPSPYQPYRPNYQQPPQYQHKPQRDPALITTGGWLGILLLLAIPVVNLILLIVWACGGCAKRQKTNFARGYLLYSLIAFVIVSIIFIVAVVALRTYGYPYYWENMYDGFRYIGAILPNLF